MADWEEVGEGGTTSDRWRRSGRWSMGSIVVVEEDEVVVVVSVCVFVSVMVF